MIFLNLLLWTAIYKTVRYLAQDYNYGILKEEGCCGSPLNRLGEEEMFSEISNENVKQFEESNAKSVITISPHCYNTFINEYPDSIVNKVKVLWSVSKNTLIGLKALISSYSFLFSCLAHTGFLRLFFISL